MLHTTRQLPLMFEPGRRATLWRGIENHEPTACQGADGECRDPNQTALPKEIHVFMSFFLLRLKLYLDIFVLDLFFLGPEMMFMVCFWWHYPVIQWFSVTSWQQFSSFCRVFFHFSLERNYRGIGALALKDLAEVQDVRAVRRRPGSASLQLASPMATSTSLQLEPNATGHTIGLGPKFCPRWV